MDKCQDASSLFTSTNSQDIFSSLTLNIVQIERDQIGRCQCGLCVSVVTFELKCGFKWWREGGRDDWRQTGVGFGRSEALSLVLVNSWTSLRFGQKVTCPAADEDKNCTDWQERDVDFWFFSVLCFNSFFVWNKERSVFTSSDAKVRSEKVQ